MITSPWCGHLGASWILGEKIECKLEIFIANVQKTRTCRKKERLWKEFHHVIPWESKLKLWYSRDFRQVLLLCESFPAPASCDGISIQDLGICWSVVTRRVSKPCEVWTHHEYHHHPERRVHVFWYLSTLWAWAESFFWKVWRNGLVEAVRNLAEGV